jgi:hypothetical protein
MHNCATFTAAVYINMPGKALIGSGGTAMITQPLFTTVEYYRAAWR